MEVTLQNVGRRYNREWIFKNLTHTFLDNSKTVVLGSNGSGKSTLAQLIIGLLTPSAGSITYRMNGGLEIADEKVYKHVSIASPYMDIFEEFTLKEMIEFQQNVKPFQSNLEIGNIYDIIELPNNSKALNYYSSGMKQRVKLALGILSDASLLILDEPTSNLDSKAIAWYQNLVDKYTQHKTVVVCSNNQKQEYEFCSQTINVEDYKK